MPSLGVYWEQTISARFSSTYNKNGNRPSTHTLLSLLLPHVPTLVIGPLIQSDSETRNLLIILPLPPASPAHKQLSAASYSLLISNSSQTHSLCSVPLPCLDPGPHHVFY